jgi:hypothetical protein
LLAAAFSSAGAQHRAPDRFAVTALPDPALRASWSMATDSSRRTFIPPRRYVVAFIVGAVVGSQLALHYAETTAPENDPTYGFASTVRAMPFFVIGSIAGALGGVTVVWIVDSVRRPSR